MLYIICTKDALRDCVLRVVYVLRSLCDATDAAVSGTQEFPPPCFFSFWFVSVWTCIFFYISWDLCGCKNMQMSCRSACFKRRVSVCRVVCFFVLFMCFFAPFLFFFCFLTCQTVEGRHTVSHFTVPWGVFWASGGRFCCSEPASLTFFLRVVCLVVEGDSEIYGEWQIIVPPPAPTSQCAVSLWGYVLIRCLSEP